MTPRERKSSKKGQGKPLARVSEKKKAIVSELENLMKTKRTMLFASISGIPGSQYQEIVKMLRGKAIAKVPRKSMILRAIDSSEFGEIKNMKNQIKDSTVILFSDEDPFDLAAELVNKKSPARAKPGQEAIYDIEIPEGPTDLVPGPAISELGALGIKIQIEKGKITIKEPKIIAKKGQKISQGAADLMSKLDIKPFSVGFIPVAAFDLKEGKLYLGLNINREEAVKELREAFSRALPFAVEIGFVTEKTIGFMISKAAREEKAISHLIKQDPQEE